jgi:hypothetical protein
MMLRRDLLGAAGAALTLAALPAAAQTPFELAVIGFQMSSETHARAANAAAAAAQGERAGTSRC